mgnify:CR=1 FL=1|jgi:hypothetical protein
MTIETIAGVVGGLLLIAGLGWKLNAELSMIRLMIEKLVVKAEGKWEQMDKLEKRVEIIESKL